jgi:hypothetical protein
LLIMGITKKITRNNAVTAIHHGLTTPENPREARRDWSVIRGSNS